jgi:UDP-GlcNAc:undecaprenyl-phosphate/decaprenyl-phosphate GlcNAc-1-phosphate transferase
LELVRAILAAAAVSLLVGGAAIVLGPKIGLLDVPDDDLKSHSRPAVPLGGAAVLLGLQAGLLVAGALDFGLLLAALVVWAMGIVDDVRGLSPVVRLVGAAVGGMILAALSSTSFSLLEAGLLVVAVVVAVNAVNLMDGLDALTGVTTSIVFIGLVAYGTVHGSGVSTGALVALGSLVGFIFWNRPPARLFLGDNGAYVVGVTLVWAAVDVGSREGLDLVALALVGVPVLDLGVTVLRRVVARAPLFAGDREHMYDLLHDNGLSVWSVVGLYAIAQAVWAATLILISNVVPYTAAYLSALLLAATVVGAGAFTLVRRQSPLL